MRPSHPSLPGRQTQGDSQDWETRKQTVTLRARYSECKRTVFFSGDSYITDEGNTGTLASGLYLNIRNYVAPLLQPFSVNISLHLCTFAYIYAPFPYIYAPVPCVLAHAP